MSGLTLAVDETDKERMGLGMGREVQGFQLGAQVDDCGQSTGARQSGNLVRS